MSTIVRSFTGSFGELPESMPSQVIALLWDLDAQAASIYLEFDCVEAGAETAYCVIASGLDAETQSVGRLLAAWRKRAVVRRQIKLPGAAQLAGLGKAAQVPSAVSGIESSSVAPVNE